MTKSRLPFASWLLETLGLFMVTTCKLAAATMLWDLKDVNLPNLLVQLILYFDLFKNREIMMAL